MVIFGKHFVYTQAEKELLANRVSELNIIEGDILLLKPKGPNGAPTPSAVFSDTKIWPNKKIPYVITPNVFSMIVDLFYDSLFLFLTLLSHVFSPKPSQFNFGRYESI